MRRSRSVVIALFGLLVCTSLLGSAACAGLKAAPTGGGGDAASGADAALFERRCADFERRLGEAVTRWKDQARSLGLNGKKIVTYHRSWSYFARAFDLQVVDFVEPRPGIPPSPNHVQNLVTRMKQGDVALLIMEDFFDPRLPRRIASQTGVPLVILPTSVADEPAIRTYFDLFDRLFAAIGPALGGRGAP